MTLSSAVIELPRIPACYPKNRYETVPRDIDYSTEKLLEDMLNQILSGDTSMLGTHIKTVSQGETPCSKIKETYSDNEVTFETINYDDTGLEISIDQKTIERGTDKTKKRKTTTYTYSSGDSADKKKLLSSLNVTDNGEGKTEKTKKTYTRDEDTGKTLIEEIYIEYKEYPDYGTKKVQRKDDKYEITEGNSSIPDDSTESRLLSHEVYLYLDNPPASLELNPNVVYRQLLVDKKYDYDKNTVTEKAYETCATVTYKETVTRIDDGSTVSIEPTKTIQDPYSLYIDSSDDSTLFK